MELQVLKEEKEYNNQCMLFQSILFSYFIPLQVNALLKSNYIMQIHHKAAAKVHLYPICGLRLNLAGGYICTISVV